MFIRGSYYSVSGWVAGIAPQEWRTIRRDSNDRFRSSSVSPWIAAIASSPHARLMASAGNRIVVSGGIA